MRAPNFKVAKLYPLFFVFHKLSLMFHETIIGHGGCLYSTVSNKYPALTHARPADTKYWILNTITIDIMKAIIKVKVQKFKTLITASNFSAYMILHGY